MSQMNRMHNAGNPYQVGFKRVLCVCSAGLLRSPTAALVLSQEPFNFNTRAAGADVGHALVPVDEVLLEWAQEIVCMTEQLADTLRNRFEILPPIVVLGIPDDFRYRDPTLIKMIRDKYSKLTENCAQ